MELNETDFEKAMSRIFEATGTRTQVELADVLGVRQSSISDAKRRKSLPDSWLISLLLRDGINPKWILSGTEPQQLDQACILTDNPAAGDAHLEQLFQRIYQRLCESRGRTPKFCENTEQGRRHVEQTHKQWENAAMAAEEFRNLEPRVEGIGIDCIVRHLRFATEASTAPH